MEEFILSDDVFEQIKDFEFWKLTDEQSLLIDKLILNEELKERYKKNVALKCLHNSQDITAEFLREIELHIGTSSVSGYVNRCYGLCRPANVIPSQDEYKKMHNDCEINKQSKEADKINKKFTSTSLPYNGTTLSYTTNPQAVYTSRLLDYKNLPKPKNAIEYSETIEAIDFTNST
ncbi:uncharacterized protein OCT59_015226 [Rhizophagus irregularis]|uniref:uncharacterized protein n=1 Tax=Rhizophagus irregularis TaxID=588596 RepID=UPI00332DE623|nr:hypothetical protein OCT59_015226 [Rhizophagus irregularis]